MKICQYLDKNVWFPFYSLYTYRLIFQVNATSFYSHRLETIINTNGAGIVFLCGLRNKSPIGWSLRKLHCTDVHVVNFVSHNTKFFTCDKNCP